MVARNKQPKVRTPRPGTRAKQETLRTSTKDAFLDAFGKTGNVLAASQVAGIARRTHYKWLTADPDYAAKYAEAERDAGDRLEHEARRRALTGVEEPVYGKLPGGSETGNGVIGMVRKYSDTLLIFLLKGAKPERYRERVEHTGKDGAPLAVQLYIPENGRGAE